MAFGRVARDPAYLQKRCTPGLHRAQYTYVRLFLTFRKLASSRPALVALAPAVAAALVLSASGVRAADDLPAGVPYASNTDPVRITAIKFFPSQPRPGDMVDAQITCTSNAAAVTAQVGHVRVNVPKKAPGIFRTRLHVPELPFTTGHQTVIITAIRTDGATAKRTVSVDVR